MLQRRMPNELDPQSSGTTVVRVRHDHDGVTVDIGHSRWIRGVVGLAAFTCMVPSAAFIAYFGIATFASPLIMMAVVPPLFVGMLMAASTALSGAFSDRSMAVLSLPIVAVGAWAFVLAGIASITVYTPILLAMGTGQLLGAAWLLYNALWFTHDRQIRVTSTHLRIGRGDSEDSFPLEAVRAAALQNGTYRSLVLDLDDGSREIGIGLPASTLSWLAKRISAASDRRRAAMTEENRPPIALHKLVGAAQTART